MSNVIEFETDRELSSSELLHQFARMADAGEITKVIIFAEYTETETICIHVAETQTQKDLFWQFSLGADCIKRG